MKRFLSILLSLCLLLGYMTINVFAAASVGVTYQGHIQNIGWQIPVSDGLMAGTNGMSYRMEALKINLVNAPAGASIRYKAHVQNIGWQNWVKDGQEAGTDGLSYRVEAIKIVLDNMPGYSIQYQTYVQNIGWQPWISDGQEAGTHGRSLRIEAMRIKIVKISENASIGVNYQGHVQNIGWQEPAANGQIAGTEGFSYRVEALKINLVNAPAGASIKYQAHVQNIGWQNMVSDGQAAGTNGQALRVEAIKITLVNLPGYSIQYQAHVQNIGWQNWVSDGQEAGTNGQALRVEAIKIRLVKTADAVKSVGTLSAVNVVNGTTADKLNLPASVSISYVDGSAVTAPVVWDKSSYNGNTSDAASYTLYGTLSLTGGVINPDNIKASVKVNVGKPTVNQVDIIQSISVAAGTSADKLGLPGSVKVTLSNGTTPTLSVKWDTSGYNGNATVTLYGTLILTTNITNPDNLLASVKVNVGTVTKPAAKLLFTFDDGYADDITTAAPYLQTKGMKATAYVCKVAATGQWGSSYMSTSNISSLYNVYGWDIGNHTVNHKANVNLSDAAAFTALEKDYLDNQSWIISMGWNRGAYHVAYPEGIYNTQLINYLKGIGVKTGRAAWNDGIPANDLYQIPCIDITAYTVAQIETQINNTISSGSTLVLMIHQVNNTVPPAGEQIISISNFQQIVDYASQKVQQGSLDVTTISEWYN